MTRQSGLHGGRYRAESLIGAGGFGAVYRAKDENTGRMVALKLLHGGLDETAQRRFKREAQMVQSLAHPNTVRVFDFSADPAGPFIAYELLDGETLFTEMKKGPMPVERAIRIIVQVLKALAEAHDKGIVHRDIKPPNVMLQQFAADRDVVKVLDFGIAKPMLGASMQLTKTGAVVGTPRFMSPEQITGDAVTPASDVYAVALMFCEMVSGRRVFEGAHVDIFQQQMSPEPVPIPPVVAQGEYRAAIKRALEKAPAQRYGHAAQLLADLESTTQTTRVSRPSMPTDGATTVAYGGPIAALTPIAPTLTDREPAARPWIFIGIAAAASALLVGAVIGLAILWRSFSSDPVSTAPQRVQGVNAQLDVFDPAALSRVMLRRGWAKKETSAGDAGASWVAFAKGSRDCVFSYVAFSNTEHARAANFELPTGAPGARFGTTLVFVTVSTGSKVARSESYTMRDAVIAALKAEGVERVVPSAAPFAPEALPGARPAKRPATSALKPAKLPKPKPKPGVDKLGDRF